MKAFINAMRNPAIVCAAAVALLCLSCGGGGRDNPDGADGADIPGPDSDMWDGMEGWDMGDTIPDMPVEEIECPPDQQACGAVCCDPGVRCVEGVCCPEDDICGMSCCGADEICMGGYCHLACEGGVRCLAGDGTEICCSDTEICFMGTCTVPGELCASDADCDLDEYCETSIGRCLPVPDTECEYIPPPGEFIPIVEWEWPPEDGTEIRPNHIDVLAPPAIGDMDGDGIPEVILISYRDACAGGGDNYRMTGVLTILDGATGAEKLRLDDRDYQLNANTAPALGDIDSDTLPEVVVMSAQSRLLAYELDGTMMWESDDNTQGLQDGALAIANLDALEPPEIFFGAAVYNAAGHFICVGDGGTGGRRSNNGISTAADLDGDGDLEIIAGNTAFHHDCSLYWENDSINNGFPGVADIFLASGEPGRDGLPEVILISESAAVVLNGRDGTIMWGPVDVPLGGGHSGAPTIADFDGDTRPEIGTAAGHVMVVFDPDGAEPILWDMPTKDTSSAVTGSTVFDFEGDGIAEIIYTDECFVYIYSGPDGTVLFKDSNNTRTQYEFPLLVDVDADGNSELVVVSNACVWDCQSFDDWTGPARRGIKIYGDELHNWVRTRKIWNQHAYHVTNINEDGTVPVVQPPNWEDDALNNFRQNVQTWGVHNAPDLTPEMFGADMRQCASGYITLGVMVMNRGSRGVDPGVNVAFYEVMEDDSRQLVGVVQTLGPLLPGMSEYVEYRWEIPPDELGKDVFHFVVVVDDPSIGEVAFHECNEDNNEAGPIEAVCEVIG